MPLWVCEVVSPWLLGILGSVIAAIHVYMYKKNGRKRYPKLIKSLNWMLLSLVYFLFALDGLTISARSCNIHAWFSLAVLLLMISEISYHGDALVEIYQAVKSKITPNE